jgi:2-oxoisovalerate dehydrogenase E1 component alpha subunit
MRVVARFEVRFTGYLDARGEPLGPLPAFAADPAALVPDYRAMVLMRALDAKAVAMQRTGQIGTYASTLGKEAIDAGIAHALGPEDVVLPSYRESGILMLRGVSPHRVFLYWGGDERGSVFPESPKDFPFNVPIASQLPHAAGVAYAMKLRREPRAALAICGDGATSKGDFYEAINAAGVWQLPMVVLVVNNQYAISVPRRMQSAAQTLAQKAFAAGIECEQVDGNDVIAVRDAATRALERARAGGGATLVEALTYRLCDHTTADDATRYRSAEELAGHWKSEPVLRLRNFLASRGAWSKEKEEQLHREVAERVRETVKKYLDTPPPAPEQMFRHLYARLPRAYAWQLAALKEAEEERDAAHHAG